ncbi:H-2 class I histocompatibility antigen, K-K alpha chain [Bagarius yarrelli]|uniref:H-2 class I histocompatibility antigen, K-K alpha chain n=1 Tax=Bagarius yarrelli TaxID=175774 RepID=A0A556VXB9_BAGYA|nr:H-2 class I histocompatibility antigen, K-K alpha chain [Bagarius yarrelli]
MFLLVCVCVCVCVSYAVFMCVFYTFTVTHTLQYLYTGATGINFPEFITVGQVDGGQFVYYDSNIRKAIPKTEWIQKVNADDPDYWNRETEGCQGQQEVYKANVATGMQRFNQTTGGASIALIAGVVAALVALVAVVVVGILIWKKKKNSGERRKEEDV